MALIGWESFDDCGPNTVPDLNLKPFTTGLGGATGGKWSLTGAVGPQSTPGQLGGRALKVQNGQQATLTLTANYTTLFVGVRWQAPASIILLDIVRFLDGASVQCGLSCNASGKLIFWRGTNATILATGTTTIIGSSYNYIEVAVTINNTTGSFEVHIGGSLEMSATNQNTRNTANNQTNGLFFISSPSSNANHDDLYVCDNTGLAPYNTFLGVCRAETLSVTTNDSVAWTPNASTNASQVQEAQEDGDTTFNYSINSGDIDTFNHGSLSSTPTIIYAVDICAWFRKDDVSTLSVRTKLKSGVTTQNGASVNPPTVYQCVRDSYINDPNTGAAWIAANVNSTKIGYEHV